MDVFMTPLTKLFSILDNSNCILNDITVNSGAEAESKRNTDSGIGFP